MVTDGREHTDVVVLGHLAQPVLPQVLEQHEQVSTEPVRYFLRKGGRSWQNAP